ncbi:hypothetical protein ACFW15_21400, partial [Streptomyces sp. NPDC058953]
MATSTAAPYSDLIIGAAPPNRRRDMIDVRDPSTGKVLHSVPDGTVEDGLAAVAAAGAGGGPRRGAPPPPRGADRPPRRGRRGARAARG